jgi:hypothetical protein
MRDRTLIATGVIGGALAAICCACSPSSSERSDSPPG